MFKGSDQETIVMATMRNERYAVEEGEEENISYTSFKTISTVKTSDGEQTKCEEQCNTAFTSYQTISTVRTWNEEDDTQAEDSTDSPCVSQSSLISTCRKGVTSPDYYSGLSFNGSKVDGSLFNLSQMNRTFQVLMDVEEHISGSSSGSCPDISLKLATDPMVHRREKLGDRITALQQLVAPFGKTDTASVLMESIGYIKFLQEQVKVLMNRKDSGDIELDLKSQGFCLVPIAAGVQIRMSL